MALRWFVRPNAYYDSMKLMRVSEALASLSGVVRAAAVMATPLNVDLLADDGLLPPDVQASPEDLLVAVLGEDEASAERALAQVDALLTVQTWPTEGPGYRAGSEPLFQARTLDGAAGANLAVVAVPGPYAATEALAALRAGLHVFLFSDNVPLEEEVRLKRLAEERDLLMMGPDCGTAIIGGVGLGFANRVERGPVGIVGASGTGIQELCCLLDAAGVGIAQAIGTGGRDLSHAVGGSMTRRAIWALEAEEDVEIIAVISKPPDPAVARRLQGELLNLHKPAVVCLLGDREATFESTDPEAGPLRYVATIVDAAQIIVDSVGGKKDAGWSADPGSASMKTGKPVCGLFAGGTLMSEAQLVLDSMGAPHRLLDLGADEYTRGRAHPILDPRLRASMVAELAGRDDVGAILFDVILGDLAHPDPAGALLPALKALSPGSASVRPRTEPSRGGRRSGRPTPLQPLFAVLVGTRRDPQGLKRQRAILEKAGVQVFPSAVSAAMAAGRLVGGAP